LELSNKPRYYLFYTGTRGSPPGSSKAMQILAAEVGNDGAAQILAYFELI
jgi:hypothetical protein